MKKILGVFWGTSSFSAVEITNPKSYKVFSSNYDSEAPADTPPDKTVSEEIKKTALLQKNLRDLKISTTDVHLSLPSKDIIFRSFTIPWMSPSEIKSVVDFESRKYIPFKLSELTYTFHPIVLGKQEKSIRILLTAIKTEILDGYCKILENSGLQIKGIEPSPVSLLRVLISKKLLPRSQRIVIVQADSKEGKIIIVDQGIPLFIRDFQLASMGGESDSTAQTQDLFNVRLFNEIKISLDYYARQNPQEKVNAILTLLSQENKDLVQLLGKEFGLPVTSLDLQTILNNPQSPPTFDVLSAYGIGLKGFVVLPATFDLPRKMAVAAKAISPLEKIILDLDYPVLLQVAALGVVMIFLTLFLSTQPVNEQKKILANLSRQQIGFEKMNKTDIEGKKKEAVDKLAAYKAVRVKSNILFLLSSLPSFLPDGSWLTNLTIAPVTESPNSAYKSDNKLFGAQVRLDMEGRVFLNDSYQQMHTVQKIVEKLKQDKDFATFFKDISSNAIASTIEKYSVTQFKVNCK